MPSRRKFFLLTAGTACAAMVPEGLKHLAVFKRREPQPWDSILERMLADYEEVFKHRPEYGSNGFGLCEFMAKMVWDQEVIVHEMMTWQPKMVYQVHPKMVDQVNAKLDRLLEARRG